MNPTIDFQACNMEVNRGFALQGDGAHNSALLLPDLVNDGVRLLVYAGNAGASNECSLSCVLQTPYPRYDV